MATPRKTKPSQRRPRKGVTRRRDVKEDILDAALSLFADAGYNAVGVKEIVDKAGVPKGSFYTYFPSKEMLGCAVIDRYSENLSDRLHALMAPDGRPVERLRRHFAGLSKDIAATDFLNGCLLGQFASETAGQSDLMRVSLMQRFSAWANALALVVAETADRDQLRAPFAPKEAASFLLNSWEGAALRACVDRNRAPLDTFQKVAFALVFKDKR
jgi:TetR/AcrR family transcriptional repressor of nem operon